VHPQTQTSTHLQGANPLDQHSPFVGVTLDTQLAWLPHIDQVRKKVAQRLRVVSINNGLLLYKQLICPVMDCACLICRLAADTHIKKKVHQFKCLRLATSAPWYIGDIHIHEDLGVPFFADRISEL